MNLQSNIILYADILEIIRCKGLILYEDDNAILVQEVQSGLLSAASMNHEGAETIISLLPKYDVMAVHDSYLKEALEDKGIMCMQTCWQCAYLKGQAPEYTLPDGYRIKEPQVKHIPQMIEMYRYSKPELANKEEFQRALKDGMIAVFYGDEMCGFIGLHEEYSMGLLEVLPEHRKKGLAYALECALIHDLLQQGALPYGQVIVGNEKSLQLQKKVGMEFCEEETYWFFGE